MGLNAFLIFMSSYKGMGPKKQFWPIRMKLSKPFHRQLFHCAENLLYELLSNIHRINCPAPVSRTKIRPLTCFVISLAQYNMPKSNEPCYEKTGLQVSDQVRHKPGCTVTEEG